MWLNFLFARNGFWFGNGNHILLCIDWWLKWTGNIQIYTQRDRIAFRCVLYLRLNNTELNTWYHEERCWLFNFFASLCRMFIILSISPSHFVSDFDSSSYSLFHPLPAPIRPHILTPAAPVPLLFERSAFTNNTRSFMIPVIEFNNREQANKTETHLIWWTSGKQRWPSSASTFHIIVQHIIFRTHTKKRERKKNKNRLSGMYLYPHIQSSAVPCRREWRVCRRWTSDLFVIQRMLQFNQNQYLMKRTHRCALAFWSRLTTV